jgi:tungstate transport system ATP-binding protein
MSSSAARPLFALRGVRTEFGGRVVVTVESLEIKEGEVTVLVGENGSGKTTLLRLLNGLVAPAEGSVEYGGKSLAAEGLAEVRRDTVLVHQSPILFRGTVGLNVSYGLRIRGVGRGEAAMKASSSLQRVGLPGFEQRRSSELSGGEEHRVALARALVLSPRVLLLDEPTANVDEHSVREIEAVIRSVSAYGTTVIVSTHDMELAYRLCDRLVRLDAGIPREAEENILKGRIEKIDEQFAYFRTGDALLRCPARQGDFTVAVLAPEELILSKKPLDSSARNQLHGIVTQTRTTGSLLMALLYCGTTMRAKISREAAEEIGVAPGAPCVVTFKASAVRLY